MIVLLATVQQTLLASAVLLVRSEPDTRSELVLLKYLKSYFYHAFDECTTQ